MLLTNIPSYCREWACHDEAVLTKLLHFLTEKNRFVYFVDTVHSYHFVVVSIYSTTTQFNYAIYLLSPKTRLMTFHEL